MADDFTDRLSDYLDGEDLSPDDRRTIDAHLAGCAECRSTLAELREVAAFGSSLPDWPPARDLWPGVARHIEGPARSNAVDLRPASAFRRRFSFTLPQLVAAGLALMVLSGGTVWLARQGGSRTDFEPLSAQVAPEAPRGEPRTVSAKGADYDEAVADLQRTIEARRGRLDPETLRVLETNLQSIDRAIAQCREALAADPSSVYLNTHLADAQRRKLSLLRRVSDMIPRS
jgi:hypothetical protein